MRLALLLGSAALALALAAPLYAAPNSVPVEAPAPASPAGATAVLSGTAIPEAPTPLTPPAAKEEAKATPGATAETDVTISDTLPERVMGDASAPVSIIEYASLTCPHCADFEKNVLPKLADKYIATGKVKLIYRDFPLDGNALKAAQLAQCMPEDRYFPFIKTLFDTQASWASSEPTNNVEASLTQLAKLAGLPGERITACFANTKLQDALVKRRMEASKQFNIEATPTFIINYGAETINGTQTVEQFDATLAKYVKGAKANGKTTDKPAEKPAEPAKPAAK